MKAVLFAIVGVGLIDGTGAAVPNSTVIVRGEHIVAVGKNLDVPRGARVIDGAGKYLIPGLWDSHVHLVGDGLIELLVAQGITGVRDMAGPIDQDRAKFQRSKKDPRGPEVITPDNLIDGPNPLIPGSLSVADEASARQAVKTLVEGGADFLKIYNMIPRDAFFALADEAKRRRIAFAGHVPLAVTALEASNAGMASFEHLTGVMLGCSSREDEIRRSILDELLNPQTPKWMTSRILFKAPPEVLLESYSAERAQRLFATLAKNKTHQVPTLIVLQAISRYQDPGFTDDHRLQFMPKHVTEDWKGSLKRTRTDEEIARSKKFFERDLALVGAMHKAGVPILAGTDMPNPYVFPGWSLHEELALLVRAGLSPMEALQSATRDAARFAGRGEVTGTIEAGKRADLVLLDADPLADIANTRKIDAVVLRGTWLDRAALDRVLSK